MKLHNTVLPDLNSCCLIYSVLLTMTQMLLHDSSNLVINRVNQRALGDHQDKLLLLETIIGRNETEFVIAEVGPCIM